MEKGGYYAYERSVSFQNSERAQFSSLSHYYTNFRFWIVSIRKRGMNEFTSAEWIGQEWYNKVILLADLSKEKNERKRLISIFTSDFCHIKKSQQEKGTLYPGKRNVEK